MRYSGRNFIHLVPSVDDAVITDIEKTKMNNCSSTYFCTKNRSNGNGLPMDYLCIEYNPIHRFRVEKIPLSSSVNVNHTISRSSYFVSGDPGTIVIVRNRVVSV
ncbi:hypothetical protein DINM_006508 [Dirofilaria immitis]|nr:hypothetical protein [Dirofilaria immitis]